MFQQFSAAVVEVGRRLRQEYYNTDLSAKYALSEKTSIEVQARQAELGRGYDAWLTDAQRSAGETTSSPGRQTPRCNRAESTCRTISSRAFARRLSRSRTQYGKWNRATSCSWPCRISYTMK